MKRPFTHRRETFVYCRDCNEYVLRSRRRDHRTNALTWDYADTVTHEQTTLADVPVE